MAVRPAGVDDPETEEVDLEFELHTTNAEAECPEYEHNPGLEIGWGENCETPNKFAFCRYCCWQPDPVDQFWMKQRQNILLEAARKKGLV